MKKNNPIIKNFLFTSYSNSKTRYPVIFQFQKNDSASKKWSVVCGGGNRDLEMLSGDIDLEEKPKLHNALIGGIKAVPSQLESDKINGWYKVFFECMEFLPSEEFGDIWVYKKEKNGSELVQQYCVMRTGALFEPILCIGIVDLCKVLNLLRALEKDNNSKRDWR